MNKLKKIVNKISSLKSVFTPADKYNDLVDNLNELTTVVDELAANSGGGNSTDLFTNTTASKFVKTNSTNDGLESTDLFANTKPYYGVGVNSTNNGFEKMKFHYSEDSESVPNILIGRQTDPSGDGLLHYVPKKSVVIGSESLNKTLTTENLSRIIAINSPSITQSNIIAIGNSYNTKFISHGTPVRRKYLGIFPDSAANPNYQFSQLITTGSYVNGSDSAKTFTITLDNIDIELRQSFLDTSANGSDKWIHTEVDFLIDNTIATGTNHVTVAVSGNDISVNGTNNLVVNAGTIGKFTAVVYSTSGGAYQKVKICRVF